MITQLLPKLKFQFSFLRFENQNHFIKIKSIITMRKEILLSISLLLTCAFAYSQNGLENVIVENYYVSDANDTNANMDGGILPLGSKTYRIFADMLPGYRFQAVYGVNTPGAPHELRISTTTLFFNNEDRGATSPTFTKTNARLNTVMLDSWLSVGAACSGQMGVLKADDDGVATVINNYSPMVLQNNDPWAGIPISVEDGMITGTPEPVTAVGISTEILVFDSQNDGTNGPLFFTDNGSWASLNGSVGIDSIDNKVLIAQITTDGVLCFELNIQIGTPTGGVENYVANGPVGNEITIPSLTFCSNTVGIDEIKNTSFKVYPNPSSGAFKIQIADGNNAIDNSYTLTDITGKTVVSKIIGKVGAGQIEEVKTNSLAKGYYTLQVQLNGAVSTQKIIVN